MPANTLLGIYTMIKFLFDNWLAIASLIIALIGGVPGIINLISQLKSRAKFIVNPHNLIFGNTKFNGDPIEYTHIIVSVIITNEGTQPLTPASFDLSIKYDHKCVNFRKTLIPPNIELLSNQQNIQVEDLSESDLQKYNGVIGQGIPISGCLMFITDNITLDELTKIKKYKLIFTCTDIFGKKHKYIYTKMGKVISNPTTYPKHGINVNPK